MEFERTVLLLTNGYTDGLSVVTVSRAMDAVIGSPRIIHFLDGATLERVGGRGGVEHGARVEFSGVHGVAAYEA